MFTIISGSKILYFLLFIYVKGKRPLGEKNYRWVFVNQFKTVIRNSMFVFVYVLICIKK